MSKFEDGDSLHPIFLKTLFIPLLFAYLFGVEIIYSGTLFLYAASLIELINGYRNLKLLKTTDN